ncbi:hypothetical protein [Pelosinus baikalensis]|uniref:Uncharacterized protein n=1 Tax=Pelosinus baikalensis TaxID=2892015 RepID=A0ABS8HWD9_9FIRM|nr:hypothetical protein [Pelosinus baikalensis]MCC5467350.1 hypothetical protein [Pelosinus baikalensis]
MKRFDSILLRTFLYGLPLILLLAIFSYSYDSVPPVSANNYIILLENFAGFMFMSWMLLSIYLGIRLMFSGIFREKVLTKLTFIKERDEREVMLTGKAAKATMLTTLAILIFLFVLSCFQISVCSIPLEKAIDGKTNIISLGVKLELLENLPKDDAREAMQEQTIFSYAGLPISSSALILGLIIWQVVAYNYSMRRLMK